MCDLYVFDCRSSLVKLSCVVSHFAGPTDLILYRSFQWCASKLRIDGIFVEQCLGEQVHDSRLHAAVLNVLSRLAQFSYIMFAVSFECVAESHFVQV